jgi:predicted RNA-binding Zn-ribbon protein involved in translation (DUF1610 family)
MIAAEENDSMFLTDCPTCGLRELRGARSIETLVSTERGHAVVYRCHRCEAVNVLGGNPAVDAPLAYETSRIPVSA